MPRYDAPRGATAVHSEYAHSTRYEHSPPPHDNSMSALAPIYTRDAFNEQTSRTALSMIPQSVVDEPVVEHEHHHIHHHIDHLGSIKNAVHSSPRTSFVHDDFERDRYDSRSVSVSHSGHNRRRSVDYRSGGGSHRGYARSDIDISASGSRRGSVQIGGTSDWTVIDVPPGTRRITLETSGARESRESRDDFDINWSRHNGVRRSRGLASELWTEITKDLITRDAIEDMGYQYEETDHFFYIFEYLSREQIDALINLTSDIRRERARELEYNSIAGSTTGRLVDASRYDLRSSYEREERPEIVYTEETTRRRARKYYH